MSTVTFYRIGSLSERFLSVCVGAWAAAAACPPHCRRRPRRYPSSPTSRSDSPTLSHANALAPTISHYRSLATTLSLSLSHTPTHSRTSPAHQRSSLAPTLSLSHTPTRSRTMLSCANTLSQQHRTYPLSRTNACANALLRLSALCGEHTSGCDMPTSANTSGSYNPRGPARSAPIEQIGIASPSRTCCKCTISTGETTIEYPSTSYNSDLPQSS